MRYEVYKADLSNRYSISHAITIMTTRNYNDIGTFTLVVPADEYHANAIEKNGLLYEVESGESYTIQNVVYDNEANELTAHGYTANWLLNKRCVKTKDKIKAIPADVYKVVKDNLRDLPRVSVSEAVGVADEESEEADIYTKQVLDGIMTILAESEWGNRMVWDDNTLSHTFEVYKGEDLTTGIHGVVFSEFRGSAKSLVMNDDDSMFKNYFYLNYKLKSDSSEADDRVYELGTDDLEDKREYWIGGSQKQKDEETEAQFMDRLKWTCKEEAERRLRRTSFSVIIDSDELGKVYNLGDKVVCLSERLGVSFEARINSVSFKMDANGSSTSIMLGEPTLTAIGEVLLKK